MRPLFILTTFLGSFLLFLIEPMVAKALLPRFGGSSLVWNGSLLFFQAALLAGYAYAHAWVGKRSVRSGVRLHIVVAVIVVGLTTLFATTVFFKPTAVSNFPLLDLLGTLTITTAAPFMFLAAGTPLIQRWFRATSDPQADDPYFLYAASNAGSLLGLLAYPTIVEPRFGLLMQRQGIGVGLLVYLLLIVTMAVKLKGAQEPHPVEAETAPPPTARQKWTWAALAAAPSALLLAATTDLTRNIAPIPLLWVMPLALYLLTFIIAFSKRTRGRDESGAGGIRLALPILLYPSAAILTFTNPGLILQIVVSLLTFFICAMACHLELAKSRPHSSHLTTYYLWLSFGGVLGGLFCALLAPLIFSGLTELPIALFACVFLFAATQPHKKLNLLDAIIPLATLLVIAYLRDHYASGIHRYDWIIALGFAFLITALRPMRFALTFAAFLLTSAYIERDPEDRVLASGRNYYGYYRVLAAKKYPNLHRLVNGSILHGLELMDQNPPEPISYYTREGPFGQALSQMLDSRPGARIGAVGLGSGSIAAYGHPGHAIDFYELNPDIERVARNPALFKFVPTSTATVSIILGDARLSLASAENGIYDAIVLDAFSSDSIPVHLLTREAFQLYKRKLKPDGIILVHTSNRYLNLDPVVASTGAAAGFVADFASDQSHGDADLHSNTTWTCLSQSRTRLDEIQGKTFWNPYQPPPGTAVWTDDYSNVLATFHLKL